jgi:hypothetical protein
MLVAALLLVLGLCRGAYSLYWHGYDEAAMHRLAALQTEHAQRCDAPAYAEKSSSLVRTLYLGSPGLRRTVEEQLASLKEGVACDEVDRALRAAEFPLSTRHGSGEGQEPRHQVSPSE